jgi:hypothetical protein
MPDQNGNLTPDERTTPLGLYHFAVTYEAAANTLVDNFDRDRVTHADSPVGHLFTHAIELYLKAYLRLKGATLDDLKSRLGHNIPKLGAEFAATGGHLDDEDRKVFDLLTPENVFGARYIVVGAFSHATTARLGRTAKSLHETVKAALRDAKVYTRY